MARLDRLFLAFLCLWYLVFSTTGSARSETDDHEAVGLICPTGGSKSIQWIKASPSGKWVKGVSDGQRLIVSIGNKPAKTSKTMLDTTNQDYRKLSVDLQDLYRIAKEHTDMLMQKICRGPQDARARYKAYLVTNQRKLGFPAPLYK